MKNPSTSYPFQFVVRKLIIASGLLVGLAISLVVARPVAAADYTITVSDGSVVKNQNIIYDYPDIGPGFSASANINIVNNSSQVTKVTLTKVEKDTSDPNLMLPYVQLGIVRGGVVLGQGTYNSSSLIGISTCVDPRFSAQLQTTFLLPANVGNDVQNTSMRVIYYFLVEQTPCSTVNPPNSGPRPLPPTGETMRPFWILGGLTVVSFGLMVIFLILTLLKKQGDKKNAAK